MWASGRRLTVLLTGVLAALLVVGAAAAYTVGYQRHAGVRGTASAGDTVTGAGQRHTSVTPTSGDSTPAGTASDTSRSAPSSAAPSHTATPTPTRRQPLAITLSASATESQYAQQVSDLLRRYFTAINNHDYDAWLATVTTAQANTHDRDQWLHDYSTTHDSEVYVSDINDGDPPTVRIQFASHQSVELAPPALPLTCVRWDVTYTIVDEGPGLRVGNSAKPAAMARCPS